MHMLEGRDVYRLLVSNSDSVGLPLHEHTAMLLATGALQDDLDDRQDILRGALEIDPILSTWVVCAAAKAKVELRTLDVAVRWLSSHLGCLSKAVDLRCQPFDVDVRCHWRKACVEAISVARWADRQSRLHRRDTRGVYWQMMLRSMFGVLANVVWQNDRSGNQNPELAWPKWVRQTALESASRTEVGAIPALDVARAAVTKQPEIVSQEEQELWFRPYPEFRQLFPLAMQKVIRLEKLEADFATTLREEKNAALQQFAYGASHEINNPLANISTRAQTLVQSEYDLERRKKLVAIAQQAFRAYDMIADLMLFAKPPQLQISKVVVDELLNSLHAELSAKPTDSNIRIRVYHADSKVECRADAVHLAVAVKAICINAMEAMPDGGQLTLRSAIHQDMVEVAIEDTGVGLNSTALRHLFDPFYSGREAGRGLGFGLCKAWRIVQDHGGQIDVESQLPHGTRFTIRLPVDGPRGSIQHTTAAHFAANTVPSVQNHE